MAGLNLGVMGGVKLSTPQSQPASIAEAAYGSGFSGPAPSRGEALAPNDAFGMSFWSGVGAIVLLLVIRHSLPR